MSLYHLNVYLHILAALLWLGGMLFFAVVGAPVIRRVDPPELRTRLFRALGEQFRWVGWACIGVLLLTGVGNLHFKGLLTAEVWTGLEYWTSTRYGRLLATKLALVAGMLGVQAIHDFSVGPGATRAEAGSPGALSLRRKAAWLGRVNAFLGLALVWTAMRLARGG